ncbi:MAG: RNA 2',3'-cyclic phosphodiesterase [Chloroflexota bacterium]
MDTIRAFIALELPPEVRAGLGSLQSRLIAGGPAPVKWVDPAGIHLTLKFLGNVPGAQVSGIAAAITRASAGINPFHLRLEGLGVFPGPRSVRVIWVGLGGELEPLQRLQRGLESQLSPLGFLPENRGFTPHLTLGRVRESAAPPERERLGQLVTVTPAGTAADFTVDAVNLMQSRLTPQGAVYRRLESVPLNS